MANPYSIEDVVDVTISLAARPITQAGFETPLILAAHNVFTDRTRTYTDASTAISDGFASGSSVHSMLTDLFAGNFAPSEVLVGRRSLTDYDVTLDSGVEADVYTINVTAGGFAKTFTETVGVAEDETDAATALAAAIELDGDIGGLVAATAVGAVVSVAPTASNVVSVGAGTSNMTVTTSSAENVDTALAAVTNETNDWFFLMAESHVEQDVLDLAAYAEANKKMYVTSNQSTDIWTSSTTDILSDLGDLQYDNTHLQAHKSADKEWPEAAVVGSVAAITPGTSDLYGNSLKGVSIPSFTRTEGDFVLTKNGNINTDIAGVGFYKNGNNVSGNPFDVIRGALYLEARMEEDIFQLIKDKSDLGLKIPYTDAGVAMVTGKIEQRLAKSVQQGFLAASPAPVVTAPLVKDVSTTDKANRLLPDVEFEATLAGSVRTIKIRGFVSV